MQQQGISLLELNSSIKKALQQQMPEQYWVVAEISELNINRSGHCYLELVQKDELTERIVAKNRAVIWAYTFRMLRPYFETSTGHELNSGLKVLVRASVDFSEVYGLSLNIKDIDPTYTLGDVARKRLEIIRQLEDEGILDMNKELELPEVPQRIAIVSSPTAAGYGDFMDQLTKNDYGIVFYCKLFESTMQGTGTEESIMNSLDRIFEHEHLFDAVVIIRGGGSKSDLACFDSYALASYIAQFPLPIISGIGHERDETIVDLVSHTRTKTPTAVAEFLISCALEVSTILDELETEIANCSKSILEDAFYKLQTLTQHLAARTQMRTQKEKGKLAIFQQRYKSDSTLLIGKQTNELHKIGTLVHHKLEKSLHNEQLKSVRYQEEFKWATKLFLESCKKDLVRLKEKGELLNPERILERGYTLTLKNGKPVKSTKELQNGDTLETKFKDGTVKSTIANN